MAWSLVYLLYKQALRENISKIGRLFFLSYNKKIVQTNSYIEVYEYDKVIISENTKKINRRSKSKNFDELEQEEQLKRLHRISKTRQNAKWKVMRLIDTNFDSKTSFLTLTTKENIQNRDCFNKIFDKFIKRLNYKVFKTKKEIIKIFSSIRETKTWSMACSYHFV